MARTPAYDEAYPPQLWTYEREHLLARAGSCALPLDRPGSDVVGVALSGGGIRSATFCLGVFQALAQLRQLARIDYVSTVSGGGYFGSFLGRLYRRRQIQNGEQVRSLLDPTVALAERPADIPDVVAWLRENGRYLSPNGGGDLLTGGAIMLRNWVTILVVVVSFALLALMSGELLRMGLGGLVLRLAPEIPSKLPGAAGCHWLWWSPWIIAPVVTLLWWAAPVAWAFWLTGRWRRRSKVEWPVWGGALTAVIAIGAIVSGQLFDPRSARLWLGVIVLSPSRSPSPHGRTG